jgi:hypothetical protein
VLSLEKDGSGPNFPRSGDRELQKIGDEVAAHAHGAEAIKELSRAGMQLLLNTEHL